MTLKQYGIILVTTKPNISINRSYHLNISYTNGSDLGNYPLNTQPDYSSICVIGSKIDAIHVATINQWYRVYLTSWYYPSKTYIGYRVEYPGGMFGNSDYRWNKQTAFKAALKEVKKEITTHQRELLNAY